ncbi:hypothetical protein QJQ45_004061 [Haematococcus lacustris]|nr:hypothetical protein QJQ45_004061 [Haematococcus lacustris]
MASSDVFDDMLSRLHSVNHRLAEKDANMARITTRSEHLERSLLNVQADLASARDELEREALRTSLLEQRLAKSESETQLLNMELNEALGAKALLDRTCGLAQSQLSSTQQELVHRVNELTEKNSYLSSVLEAKEASIQSLHQLLRAKQAMAEASEADSQQLRKLRSRVLELETQGIEQAKQVRHLEKHLREREKLLVKAEKRHQELSRRCTSLTVKALSSPPGRAAAGPAAASTLHPALLPHPTPSLPGVTGLSSKTGSTLLAELLAQQPPNILAAAQQIERDVARDQAQGMALQQAEAQLRAVAQERAVLQEQFQLIQEAFEEERAHRARLRAKLSAKLKAKTDEVEAQARELRALQLSLDAQKQRADAGAADATASKLAHQHAELLRAELDSTRARHTAEMASQADREAAVRLDNEKHQAHIQELEAQVQRLAAGGGVAGMEQKAAARLQQARLDRLEADLAARSTANNQLQHSLYVVRAHWGGLRRLLAKLLRQVADTSVAHAGGSTADDHGVLKALKESKVQEQLGGLMRDWEDVGNKSAFDAAAEQALGAGCTILEQALEQWQALSKEVGSARLAARAAAAQQHSWASQREGELKALKCQAQEATLASEQAASEVRSQAAHVAEQLAATRNEVLRLTSTVREQEDQLDRARAAANTAHAERKAMQAALTGSQGELQVLVAEKDSALKASQRKAEDLEATVAALHSRLEHTQASLAQVGELKQRLRQVMATPLQVPQLLPSLPKPPMHMANGAAQWQHGANPANGSTAPATSSQPSDLNAMLAALLADAHHPAYPASTSASASRNSSMALPNPTGFCWDAVAHITTADPSSRPGSRAAGSGPGGAQPACGDSPMEMDAALEGALGQAQGEVQAALAGQAVLEVCHWELSRGLEELMTLLECPYPGLSAQQVPLGSSSRSRPASQGAAAGPPASNPSPSPPAVPATQLQADLKAAQQAALTVVAAVKAAGAQLQGLQHALPAWLALTRAQAQAAYRGELSRMRAGGQLSPHTVSTSKGSHGEKQTVMQPGVVRAVQSACAQYVLGMEQGLRSMRQQLSNLVAGGSHAEPQLSAADQELLDLEHSRQATAQQLLQLVSTLKAIEGDTGSGPARAATAHLPMQPLPDLMPAVASHSQQQQQQTPPGTLPGDEAVALLQASLVTLQANLTDAIASSKRLDRKCSALAAQQATTHRRASLLVACLCLYLPLPPDLEQGLLQGLQSRRAVSERRRSKAQGEAQQSTAARRRQADSQMSESSAVDSQDGGTSVSSSIGRRENPKADSRLSSGNDASDASRRTVGDSSGRSAARRQHRRIRSKAERAGIRPGRAQPPSLRRDARARPSSEARATQLVRQQAHRSSAHRRDERNDDRVFEEVTLRSLQQILTRFLQQLEEASFQAGREAEKVPASEACQAMHQQLAQAQQSLADLQQEVCGLVKEQQVRLEDAQQQCLAAAHTALDAGLAKLRSQVQQEQAQLSRVMEGSTAAVHDAVAAVSSAAQEGAAAAGATDRTIKAWATELQAQLHAESEARALAVAQAEQAEAQAAAQRDKDHAGATRLEAEVGALRQRLAEAEHSLAAFFRAAVISQKGRPSRVAAQLAGLVLAGHTPPDAPAEPYTYTHGRTSLSEVSGRQWRALTAVVQNWATSTTSMWRWYTFRISDTGTDCRSRPPGAQGGIAVGNDRLTARAKPMAGPLDLQPTAHKRVGAVHSKIRARGMVGYYKVCINNFNAEEEIDKHILKKYEIQAKLGKGRTFREVMFLQELNQHENIIRLVNVLKAENDKDLYLIFEYMETDLHAVIRAQILEDVHKQYIMYQLFKALLYMHTGELLHRDIKPSNLLLNSDCQVKLADFGLARSVSQLNADGNNNPILTDYVATRWYRAPEILLGSTKYTYGVDMWSSGCILGELLLGKPIFPGTSTMNQLDRILEVTGKPSPEDVDSVDSPFAGTMMESCSMSMPKRLGDIFPSASAEALDLLRHLLVFNPHKRLSVQQALRHPYVAQFHNSSDELVCPKIILLPISDNTKYTVQEYRCACRLPADSSRLN